jgi:hypothetical protein
MIARLGPDNILQRHGIYLLHHGVPASWFAQVRQLCTLYGLPDPLLTLTSPPASVAAWKTANKTAVRAYWHAKLVADAAALPSLCFLRPAFLPLGRGAHPLWRTCGASPTAVRAATVQARMLSGRYRTDWMRRHWAGEESGACRLPGCGAARGDLPHLLAGACPALAPALARVLGFWDLVLKAQPLLLPPVLSALQGPPVSFVTFVLDPSTDPAVIALCQRHGRGVLDPLFRLSRAWVWAAHRERLRQLGLHQYLV